MLATHDAKPPLVRRIDGLGNAAGFRLKQSLAVAIRRFGPPSREQQTSTACEITWSALDLQGTFVPGGHGPRCSLAGRATSLRAGARWSTPSGLRVGDRVAVLKAHYPRSEPTLGLPGTAYSYWYLVPSFPGNAPAFLRAEVSGGRVDALIATVAVS